MVIVHLYVCMWRKMNRGDTMGSKFSEIDRERLLYEQLERLGADIGELQKLQLPQKDLEELADLLEWMCKQSRRSSSPASGENAGST